MGIEVRKRGRHSDDVQTEVLPFQAHILALTKRIPGQVQE